MANNQGCDFSHMTKILESGSEGWYDGSMKPPRAQAASIFSVQPSLTCDPHACLPVDNHFWHLASIPGRKKRKSKGKRAQIR